MATIKSYTDLEQSKKLAKILPLESADMVYVHTVDLEGDEHYDIDFRDNQPLFEDDISAWSLAALLNVLPYTIKLSNDAIDANGNPAYKNECYKFSINRCGLFGDKWNTQYDGKHQRQLGKRYKELYIDLLLSENYNNPVDACYEMVIKLKENNLL